MFIRIKNYINYLRAKSRWNWHELTEHDLTYLQIPKDFLWGSGSCEYQHSGAENCSHNNWAEWEEKQIVGKAYTIKQNQKSGISVDHWHRYKDDILLMKNLELNAYRFSLDWGEIEPEEGLYNYEAIQHYIDLCDELKRHGITPMVTLLHFTYPQWFDKKGGFEQEENIVFFIRFCKHMFNILQSRVTLWCTINEPPVMVLMGYILGEFPPGKKNRPLAGIVFKNLLKAHCEVYQALKALPGGPEAQIGIVHSSIHLVSLHWWNIITVGFAFYFNHIKNNAFIKYFKTGKFIWYPHLGKPIRYTNPNAPQCLDFFGLNYYSRIVIGFREIFSKSLIGNCYPGETMTDMPYPIYPEGLYHELMDAAQFNVPIYVTENGIADDRDDRRELFIKRHLYVMSKAIAHGCDVRGYFYWSLTDNFEWVDGFSMCFGLYEVNFQTQQRSLRQGASCYKTIIQNARPSSSDNT